MGRDGGFPIGSQSELMLDLLNGWMTCEFGRKREEGEGGFSTFRKGFSCFSNDVYIVSLVRSKSTIAYAQHP
jgi:hypothetical protein